VGCVTLYLLINVGYQFVGEVVIACNVLCSFPFITYKTAKKLNDILKQCLYLDNRYNTINSTSLANDIVKLSINNKHRMITYDVKDLYTNVPVDKTLKITEIQLLKNNDKHKTKQIITILKSILAQNYFTFHDTIYHPNKGVAMGYPISGTMAEIFLQHI